MERKSPHFIAAIALSLCAVLGLLTSIEKLDGSFRTLRRLETKYANEADWECIGEISTRTDTGLNNRNACAKFSGGDFYGHFIPESPEEAKDMAVNEDDAVCITNMRHSYTSTCSQPKAQLFDTNKIRHISYDPNTKRLTVGPGLCLGAVARMLYDNKRTLPHGSCPSVGVGGYTLGGGKGIFARRDGLMCDALHSALVQLPNGKQVNVTATSNPDLFFILCGGLAQVPFLVLEFVFDTNPLPYMHSIRISRTFPYGDNTTIPQVFNELYDYTHTSLPHFWRVFFWAYNTVEVTMVAFSEDSQDEADEALTELTKPFLWNDAWSETPDSSFTDYWDIVSFLGVQEGTPSEQITNCDLDIPEKWGSMYNEGMTYVSFNLAMGEDQRATVIRSMQDIYDSIAQESTTFIKTYIDCDASGGAVASVSNSTTAYNWRNDKVICQIYHGDEDIFTSSIPVTYGALDNLAQIQNQQLIGRYPNYRDHYFESTATLDEMMESYYGDAKRHVCDIYKEYTGTYKWTVGSNFCQAQ